MKIRIKYYLVLVLALFMAGCGVGGVSTDEDKKSIDVNGNWFFKADITLTQCDGLDDYENIYSVTLSQTDTTLQVISPFGTFDGSIEDDEVSWSGQYFDEHLEKYLTFSNVQVTVKDLSLSGSGKLEVRDVIDGNLICAGDFTLTGSTILETGEPPVAPETKAIADAEVTDTTVKLRWVDRSVNEDGFVVERSTNPTSDFVVVSQVIANLESFDDTGLSADTSYFYRVKATNNTGDSSYSEIQPVTTSSPPVNVPQAPTNLAASNIMSGSVDLNWTDNSDNETGFNIERSDDQGQSFSKVGETTVGTTTFNDSGLAAKTQYQFRVHAFNSAGNSLNSNVVEITTLDTPPAAPVTLILSSKTDVSVQISWDDKSDNEQNFVVERSLLADSGFAVIATLGSNTTSYQDTLLTAQTNYFYRVKATNVAGDSGFTNTLSVTTNAPPLQAPLTPTGFSVVASKTELSIILTWNDVANESNYEVERRTDITGSFEKIITLDADAQTYTDSNILNKDTEYFYRVRATNTAGVSGYTDSLSATSAHDADPVTDLSAAAAANGLSVDLSWTAPDNILSIEVQRSDVTAIGPYSTIATLAADADSYQDMTVAIGTTYFYKVVTINDLDIAPVTTSITTPDLPLPPQDFNVIASIYNLSADVSWTDGANETSYEIAMSTAEAGPYNMTFGVAEDLSASTIALPNIDTTYYVKMKAINAVGSSDYSGPINIQSAHAANPVTNLNIVALADASSVTISWSASVNALAYRVERAISSGPFTIVAELDNSTLSFTDGDVDPGTRYYYEVYAINDAGENSVQGTLLTPAPPIIPTGLVATANIYNTTASLSWNNVANETAYEIQYGVNPSGAPTTKSLGANVTSDTLSGLAPNTEYYVRIRAINAVGASIYSPSEIFTSARAADAVTGFSGESTASGSAVDLTWTTKSNASTYNIQRRLSTTVLYTNLVLGVSGNTGSYSDSTVTPGLTYYYRIQSVNSVGVSSYVTSGAVIVNTPPTTPAAPTGLDFTIKVGTPNSLITATWVDNATNESGYRIYGATVDTLFERRFYTLVDGGIPANTQKYAVEVPSSGLPTTGYFCVKIEAYNASGTSFDDTCKAP